MKKKGNLAFENHYNEQNIQTLQSSSSPDDAWTVPQKK